MGHSRLWLLLLLTAGVASAGCSVTRYVYVGADGQEYVYDSPPADAMTLSGLHAAGGGAVTEGNWSTDLPNLLPGDSPHQIVVRTQRESTTISATYWAAPREIVWPIADGPIHMVLQRPAGTFVFDGRRLGADASGTFRFEPTPHFVEDYATLFGQAPAADRLPELALLNFDLSEARTLHDAGYALSLDDVLALNRAGVEADYAVGLKSAGYHFDARDLIHLHNTGIHPEYAMSLRKAGYDFSAEDLVRLRNSGIEVEFAAALVVPERKNLPAEEIIRLRNRGLDAQTIRRLRE